MKTLEKISQCRREINILRKRGYKIGLVPTMGYLHEGHLSLVRLAKKECDIVFMTIFVNPAQFGPSEDPGKYPRNPAGDILLAESSGVDYLFKPSAEEIYQSNYRTYVEVEGLSDIMCGKSRPGHFRGVATIVLKLFNIICADRAYFGKKDYQQLIIIRKMVSDLNIDIEIVEGPTIREKNGLALSSRNKYLGSIERENAAVIYKNLKNVESAVNAGEKDLKKLIKNAIKDLKKNIYVKKIDYFDIRDAMDLKEIEDPKEHKAILVAAAVWIGKTRLIDNIVIDKKK
ncbi:MAG TPA: pantoate--beta-alanine ligase [Actinobacteria bacterium]|nr:pantoate--beta-alanine ligase [Actinomycetota bacterium]